MAEFIDPQELMYTSFEPMLKHRFRMEIDGIPTYMIKKVDKPQATSTEVEIPHINVSSFVKGKTKWSSETTLELYNPISPSGTAIVMEWFRMHHESVTGRDGYFDMYAKDVTVEVLGPVGDIVESWTYKGAWIKSMEFGDLDWGTEADQTMITLTLQYNFPVFNY